jgi:hypothetical protein
MASLTVPISNLLVIPFFTLERSNDRWLLHDLNGEPFCFLGINRIDESNLLHPHNESKYSSRYPTRDVFVCNTVTWPESFYFNTLGWTREYIAGSWDQGGTPDWHTSSVDLLHSAR